MILHAAIPDFLYCFHLNGHRAIFQRWQWPDSLRISMLFFFPTSVVTGQYSKDGSGKVPLELDRPAAVNEFVKQPSCGKQPSSDLVRDCLSPQLIRNFPAESFAFLEQLSQM